MTRDIKQQTHTVLGMEMCGSHMHCPGVFCLSPESGALELMKGETWSMMERAS